MFCKVSSLVCIESIWCYRARQISISVSEQGCVAQHSLALYTKEVFASDRKGTQLQYSSICVCVRETKMHVLDTQIFFLHGSKHCVWCDDTTYPRLEQHLSCHVQQWIVIWTTTYVYCARQVHWSYRGRTSCSSLGKQLLRLRNRKTICGCVKHKSTNLLLFTPSNIDVSLSRAILSVLHLLVSASCV